MGALVQTEDLSPCHAEQQPGERRQVWRSSQDGALPSAPASSGEGRIQPTCLVGRLRSLTNGPVHVYYFFCCLSRASLKASHSAELQPVAICPFLLKQTLYRLVLVKFMGCWVKH